MHLDRQHAFQDAAVFVQVDQIGCRMSVDPVLMMIGSHQDAVVVPLVGGEFFDGKRADDLLRETGVGPSLRADQITPDQFGEMANFFIASAKSSGVFTLKKPARSGSKRRSSASST